MIKAKTSHKISLLGASNEINDLQNNKNWGKGDFNKEGLFTKFIKQNLKQLMIFQDCFV
jgi:hypothetical protein